MLVYSDMRLISIVMFCCERYVYLLMHQVFLRAPATTSWLRGISRMTRISHRMLK